MGLLPPRQIWCNFDVLNLNLLFEFSSAKSIETGVFFAVLNVSSVFFESDVGSHLVIHRETPNEASGHERLLELPNDVPSWGRLRKRKIKHAKLEATARNGLNFPAPTLTLLRYR